MEKIIPESLKPTYENVSKFFILTSMNEIVFNKQLANFYIEFKEKEAIDFIEKELNSEIKKFNNKYLSDYGEILKKRYNKLLNRIKKGCVNNAKKPVMIVRDYKSFFSLLTDGYGQIVENYFKECECLDKTTWGNYITIPAYVLSNYCQYIWQRMKPEDFNDPEKFLEKQNQMLKDNVLARYDRETCLGSIQSLDANILCVKNIFGESCDECNKQLEITIYDKKYYDEEDSFNKPKCVLPLIRYGVYEKDGKKICYIGSIQRRIENLKDEEYSKQTNINKTINRKKFKVNDEVPIDNIEKVEPMNVLALSIFIDIMNKEGITDFEIPSLYVLDYEFHEKRSKEIGEEFKKNWDKKEVQEKNMNAYLQALEYKKRNYQKEDIISEIKTERIIKNFERMLYHYKNGRIISYPGEIDHSFYISIPKIKSKEELKGKLLREIFDIVDEKYKDEMIVQDER